MCDLCKTFGLDADDPNVSEQPAEESERLRMEENEDGTISLTLTKEQLVNLTMRLLVARTVTG